MLNWFNLIVVALAAGAIIEVWHKGSVFSTARAYTQAWQDVIPHDSPRGLLLELINCPFCKSYHVPFYLFLLLLAGTWFGGTFDFIVRLLLCSLAATRLGNVIDGLLPKDSQYTQ